MRSEDDQGQRNLLERPSLFATRRDWRRGGSLTARLVAISQLNQLPFATTLRPCCHYCLRFTTCTLGLSIHPISAPRHASRLPSKIHKSFCTTSCKDHRGLLRDGQNRFKEGTCRSLEQQQACCRLWEEASS